MGETPQQVTTFINQFMVVKGDFPKSEFRVLEWIHSFEKSWWSRMVSFVLDELKVIDAVQALHTSQDCPVQDPTWQSLLLRHTGALQSRNLYILHPSQRDKVCHA